MRINGELALLGMAAPVYRESGRMVVAARGARLGSRLALPQRLHDLV